ncbi:hypothetical protein JXA56_03770 [Candidatus Micrarchaeota archaeon]|nr:hypothetical protein [Candidatus Micrarchaeota archaeon]
MGSLTVAKFGGTSVATADSMRMVAGRLRKNNDARVVVVSAPGKINKLNDPSGKSGADRIKMTDRLIRIKKEGLVEEEVTAIEKRFAMLEEGLGIEPVISPKIREYLATRLEQGQGPAIDSAGEYFNGPLFAEVLSSHGMKAIFLEPKDAAMMLELEGGRYIVPERQFEEIKKNILRYVDEGYRVVLPGFYGYDGEGRIQTFERGGSDYSGAIIAAALGAGLYQNFTDVDGIFAVEPEVASNAPLISTMTHNELTELTLGGKFGVFQYAATVPLLNHRIGTQVLNTFNEDSDGTYVLPQRGKEGNAVTGIVHRGHFVGFEINKPGIANLVGFLENLAGMFASMGTGISIEAPLGSTNRMIIIVKEENIQKAGLSISDVVQTLRMKIMPQDIMTHRLSTIAVVGQGLSWIRDAGRRILQAVESADVDVPIQQQFGITKTLWAKEGDGLTTARAIYNEFFSNGGKR